MPSFEFTRFIDASMDTLVSHPWMYMAIVVAACLIVVNLCFAIAEVAAQRTVAKRHAAVRAEIEQIQRESRDRVLKVISRNYGRDEKGAA